MLVTEQCINISFKMPGIFTNILKLKIEVRNNWSKFFNRKVPMFWLVMKYCQCTPTKDEMLKRTCVITGMYFRCVLCLCLFLKYLQPWICMHDICKYKNFVYKMNEQKMCSYTTSILMSSADQKRYTF